MTAPDSAVRAERHGSSLVLTLNRPQARNALTADSVRELAGVVRGVEADVRAIIITGAPPTFCAGGDLKFLMKTIEKGSLAASQSIYDNFHGLVRALLSSRVPIIAAVNGPALGAGLDLAMCCDIRLAADRATFASSWIHMGLVTGMGGSWLLSRAIGGTRAAEMLLLGEPITAERAETIGLINRVVPEADLMKAALEIGEKFAKLSATGLAATKGSLRRSLDVQFEAELATLGAIQGSLLAGEDFNRAAERFLKPRT